MSLSKTSDRARWYLDRAEAFELMAHAASCSDDHAHFWKQARGFRVLADAEERITSKLKAQKGQATGKINEKS